ncbi:MAG: phosphatidylglycerol lysyltransferase domain-containing protein [Firmicutes bacterium]|nr:phosphatidylglycerol lysyltransferase domain-containing protein [Bacillota bacterium]
MSLKEESEQIRFINKLTDEGIFHEPVSEDFAEFEKYSKKTMFGDLSFTSCYIWEESMHYRVRITPHAIFILFTDIDGDVDIYVLSEENKPLPPDEITLLKNHFDKANVPLQFECVSESDLALFREYPFEYEVSFDDNFSDYIYDNADFISLEGKRNRTKRHEYHRFTQRHPNAIFIPCNLNDMTARCDCELIFDKWCAGHSCGDCLFGCERKAFSRLNDIYDPEKHIVGVVRENDIPISFGFGEFISDECVFFHIQKNHEPIDGLTYFLHRNMAERMHPNVKYINWGEDMGLEGIRRNKSRYHPIELKRKYKVRIK